MTDQQLPPPSGERSAGIGGSINRRIVNFFCYIKSFLGIVRSVGRSIITTGDGNTINQGGDITVGHVSGQGIAIGPGATVIYQTILQPLPVSRRGRVMELITLYTKVFGGRDAELALLDAFLTDPRPYGLLVAPTGLGKTALLVHWIARVQQRGDWRVLFVPISIRFETASADVALELLAHGLAELHGDLAQLRQYERSPLSLRALIADYFFRPLPAGTRLLLVLDGLDEAVGWEVGTLLVPPDAGIKIVAAARQRADRDVDGWRAHLGWDVDQVACFTLERLSRAALCDLLRAQGEPFATLAADPAFVIQFERVSEGDPLTCNLLIKALRAGTLTAENLSRRPPGLKAFIQQWWIENLRKAEAQSDTVRELLALCAIAYGPLTDSDLRALAPTVFPRRAVIQEAVEHDPITRFIITVGDHSYVFSHQRLREVFLEDVYGEDERAALHQRLVTYGQAWWTNRQRPLPTYLRQFWLEHCAAVGEWDLIREVVSAIVPTADGRSVEQPWQVVRYAAEGSDSGYLGDLDRLWRWAEEQRDWGLALRCALIVASLHSRSGNLPPELLVALVQVGTPAGRWSAAAALEHIAHMPDSSHQAACIEALLKAGVELPWERALEVARAIGDAKARAQALAALAPHLPPGEQPTVYAEALAAAREIDSAYRRSNALAALAPHLPPALLTEALAAAREIADGVWRSNALAALAPHLPPALLPEALAAAREIADDWSRSNALAALAPHLAALPTPDNEFATTLRILARRGRPALLHDLNALQPWLEALAKRHDPTLLSMLATAIIEAGRCWP
ncbi:hypothetical protein [Chloroflexus sp.]|uniref:hypothetical protein n=1 Tax=Chloroflexus sp. TaxID=1904827 RepID=UPI00257E6F44|nr:hypothetical protein [Chloroflexus sp.]